MRKTLNLIMFATLSACGGSATGTSDASLAAVAGTYQLKSVEGVVLPWSNQSQNIFNPQQDYYKITSGSLVLRPDGSMLRVEVYQTFIGVQGGPPDTVRSTGTYALSLGVVSSRESGASIAFGRYVVTGDTLSTVENIANSSPPHGFVFVR